MESDGGIVVSGPGAHDQSFQGGEAHGSIHGNTVLYGVDGGTVTDVGDDHIGFKGIVSQKHRRTLGGVQKRSPVKAVTPDAVIGVPGIGQGIQEGFFRHGLVPGGIHDGAVGDLGQDRLGRFDTDQIGGDVKGRQGFQFPEGSHGFIVDDNRFGELLPSVNYPVTHRLDLIHRIDGTVVGVEDGLHEKLHGFFVGRTVPFDLHLFAPYLLFNFGSFDTDSFYNTAGQNLIFIPVKDLVFQR